MDTKAKQGAAAQGPGSEASYGPALCVWCGATLAAGDWDPAAAIAASKEHVQKCPLAPWGKRIAALEEALDRIRRGAGGIDPLGRMEMARIATAALESSNG